MIVTPTVHRVAVSSGTTPGNDKKPLMLIAAHDELCPDAKASIRRGLAQLCPSRDTTPR